MNTESSFPVGIRCSSVYKHWTYFTFEDPEQEERPWRTCEVQGANLTATFDGQSLNRII